MTIETDSVIRWLLEGDAAIRWQTMRDLAGADKAQVERERRLIARNGWGAAPLARQDANGMLGPGMRLLCLTNSAIIPRNSIALPPNAIAHEYCAEKGTLLYFRQMLMGLLRLRYATFALLIVMVAGVCCANALPRKSTPSTSDRTSFLRFGQSLAVADFDGDNHIDTATLSGAGRSKDIEIHLSRAKARILLRFNTLTSELGSLFTSDIDNDGDNDLIWSDLLRADNVVVWLDDGTGRFDRVTPGEYAKMFVLSNGPTCSGFEIPREDSASSSKYNPSSAILVSQKADCSTTTGFFGGFRCFALHSGNLRTPSDRGPPLL